MADRDLDDAMLAFVRKARSGDAIRGCFYEFSYGPVLAELAEAIERGLDVKLVVDCKVNEHTVNEKQPDGTTKPVFYGSSPRLTNLAAIAEAALPRQRSSANVGHWIRVTTAVKFHAYWELLAPTLAAATVTPVHCSQAPPPSLCKPAARYGINAIHPLEDDQMVRRPAPG